MGEGLRGWGEYPGLGTFSSAGQVLKEVCFNHPNSSSYQAKSSDHSTIGSRVEQKLLTFEDNIVIQFDSSVSSGNSLDVFHTPKKKIIVIVACVRHWRRSDCISFNFVEDLSSDG